MKTAVFISTLFSFVCISTVGVAYDGEHGEKNMVVGGRLSSGFAMVAGQGYEDWMSDIFFDLSRSDRTAKYAVGGDAYFDFYFRPMFAVEAGFGFVAGGIRFRQDDDILKEAVTYMEIPVCFKVDYKHFQGSAGLVLFVALSGTTTVKDTDAGSETKTKWNNSDRWQYVHRANFGPKLSFSYAVPVGPVFVVPGISWSIHLVNDLNNDEIPGDQRYNMRANNLMFNVGVEWGFGARVLLK